MDVKAIFILVFHKKNLVCYFLLFRIQFKQVLNNLWNVWYSNFFLYCRNYISFKTIFGMLGISILMFNFTIIGMLGILILMFNVTIT